MVCLDLPLDFVLEACFEFEAIFGLFELGAVINNSLHRIPSIAIAIEHTYKCRFTHTWI